MSVHCSTAWLNCQTPHALATTGGFAITADDHEGPGPSTAERMLRPLMAPVVSLQTAIVDARFVRRQGVAPSVMNRLLLLPAMAIERLRSAGRAARQDVIFARFRRLHGQHYGPGGRGYQDTAGGTPEERAARYAAGNCRLADYVDTCNDLLGYSDGDSFADIGCGSGQNIRYLAQHFPHSSLLGVDLNADAIELIRDCESAPGLTLAVGDIRDAAYLDALLTEPVDHIVMSHVMSLLFADTAGQTRQLRQSIIDTLVARSRRSVIVIDAFGAPGELHITIEQRQRALVTDDVLSYFRKHRSAGRAILTQSSRGQAVIFTHAAA